MDTYGRQRLQESEDNLPAACRYMGGREEGKERGEEGAWREGREVKMEDGIKNG